MLFNTYINHLKIFIPYLTLSLALSGCVTLAPYDQRAYENATFLKAEVAAFVNQAGAECNIDHNKKYDLLVRLEAAYEYANGVEYNNEAANNWRSQIDSLVESYFIACKAQQKLSPVFFDEVKNQINEGFDTIICLEANKREITKCENLK